MNEEEDTLSLCVLIDDDDDSSTIPPPPPPPPLPNLRKQRLKPKTISKLIKKFKSQPIDSKAVATENRFTAVTKLEEDSAENNEPIEKEEEEMMKSKGFSKTSQFEIQGICCASELPMLLSTFDSIRGYEKLVSFNPAVKMVAIQHSSMVSAQEILLDLKKNGYVCKYLSPNNEKEGGKGIEKETTCTVKFWLLFFSFVFWVISLFSFIPKFSFLEYFGLPSLVFGLPPIIRKAFTSLNRCKFCGNCLTFLASLGAVALGEFTEAASVVFLFSAGEYLEYGITSRARQALKDICKHDVLYARVCSKKDKNKHSSVPASQVEIGTTILVLPSEKIPCDGVIIEGQTSVNESLITGESKPIPKSPKDFVIGGSLNIGPSNIYITTTSLESESAHAKFIRLVEMAQNQKSPMEKSIDRFAQWYTPIVLGISIFMCTIPWFWGVQVGRTWFHSGLILILIACPCAITIASPVCYVSAIASLAKCGIVVKGSGILEALGNLTTIVFDKTGTLTFGDFQVQNLQLIQQENNYFMNDEILAFIASMEELSTHPLSYSIIKAAREKMQKKDTKEFILESHVILPGEGVTARINDTYDAYIGNERLFERLELLQTLEFEELQSLCTWKEKGSSVGFFGIQGIGILAMYCVADHLRKESAYVISDLEKRLKLDVLMLTGDSENAAKAIGKEVGIKEKSILSQLFPEEKLQIVLTLMDKTEADLGDIGLAVEDGKQNSTERWNYLRIHNQPSRVLFCGDGLNDAPAITASDVGVAMGSGASMSMEISDITLMNSNLNHLVYAIETGARVNKTIKENIIFALVLKAIIVIITFCGKMSLLGAIGSDVGGMLLVLLNGMKLLSKAENEDIDEKTVLDESMDNSLLDEEENFDLIGRESYDPNSNETLSLAHNNIEIQLRNETKNNSSKSYLTLKEEKKGNFPTKSRFLRSPTTSKYKKYHSLTCPESSQTNNETGIELV